MENEKDVGFLEDFIFTISNLYAFETHCLSSFGVTKDEDQLNSAMKARKVRSDLMYRHIKKSDNQVWCELKHCSGIIMGLKELANRYLTIGDKKLAEECLNESSVFESLFILLNGGEK